MHLAPLPSTKGLPFHPDEGVTMAFRNTRRRAVATTATAAVLLLGLAACAPGSSAPATQAAGAVSTDAPTEDITITIQDETGFPVTSDLADEFTKQYPNVKFDIKRDSFQNLLANSPRLLASDDAPDLIRLSTLGTTVKDGLLTNLDPYFDAYGWDKFPAGQLAGARMDDDGVRG